MAITDLLLTNQGTSTSTGAINNTSDPVTFSVASGDGNLKFPAITGSQYFKVVVANPDGTYEIMKCTSRTGDALTCTRAQEGTTKISFSSGAVVSVRFTAGDVADLLALTGNLIARRQYITGGPFTWTKPDGCRRVFVEVWGAGGGGGGTTATGATTASVGGGGGGGGFASKLIEAASLGATETVTVGASGTGVSGATGNSGGTSSFGSHCSATGGGGGVTAGAGASFSGGTGGAGGAGSGGDTNLIGCPGANGLRHGDGGQTPVLSIVAYSGAGGAGAGGGSGGGRGIVTSSGSSGNSVSGYGHGGGGGGAAAGASQGAFGGGSGAYGAVVVWEFK